MTEQLKELIEKIQQEGVKAAEDKARAIEDEARQQARVIIEEARKEAEITLLTAKDKASRNEEATRTALKQVGRDVLLSIKQEINAMLGKLIAARVREALSPQELAQALIALIKETALHTKEEIVVTLKKEDAQKLEQGFLGELKKHVQKGIVLKSSDDIHGGFTISYDSGKSMFDFTDRALAEYIAASLKPKLADVLGEGK